MVAVSLVVATMSALYTRSDIAGDRATQAELTWIVDSYTLALAGLVLTAGALWRQVRSPRHHHRGLALFAVSSILPLWLDSHCGSSRHGRGGVRAAFVITSTLILLTASFPPERRGAAVGT